MKTSIAQRIKLLKKFAGFLFAIKNIIANDDEKKLEIRCSIADKHDTHDRYTIYIDYSDFEDRDLDSKRNFIEILEFRIINFIEDNSSYLASGAIDDVEEELQHYFIENDYNYLVRQMK